VASGSGGLGEAQPGARVVTALRKAARANALPIVVGEWRRTDRETVRITLDHDVIDLRSFFHADPDEPPRPGRSGITLPLQHLPALFDGISRAHSEALARGLIDSDKR
jgi:hypothetical protein